MKIVIFGAGAIGSLFGAYLSKKNKVVLIGRKQHVESINNKGLEITGITNLNAKLIAKENIKNISFSPDVIILSVKSYDTFKAVKSFKDIIGENTLVVSLQNGLDNIDKIEEYVAKEKIIVCITTHGSIFSKPGSIIHTGLGKTIIGSVCEKSYGQAKSFALELNNSGINSKISKNIIKDMWAKAIINSSINPLTTVFKCKNGYLIKNPVLENIVKKICKESTNIANLSGFNFKEDFMVDETFDVITNTKDNFSSMLQSFLKGRKTEIDSINGVLIKKAKEYNSDPILNKIVYYFLKNQ
jgi:2-dehydropantoate 2-reductase